MTEVSLSPARWVEYEKLTNEQLRVELAKQISLTSSSLMRAAEIWTELQRRGVDMSAFRSGLALYLPRIARLELAAESVVTFAGQRKLLQHLVGMPLEDQRRYAAGEPVKVAERDESGRVVELTRRLTELSGREVDQVLGQGRIRSMSEQKSSLAHADGQPTRIRRRAGSSARVLARDGLLHVGRVRLEPLDLAIALKALGFDLVRRG